MRMKGRRRAGLGSAGLQAGCRGGLWPAHKPAAGVDAARTAGLEASATLSLEAS
jgi:hypothetical protein